MKNNKNLKVAAGLLVLVLLTTCVIGTTLARYTTADSASDTARVAKWGIELAVGGNLFGTNYAENSTNEGANKIIAATSHSVSAFDGNDVVAPGTKNDVGFKVDVKGQPEVSYKMLANTANNEDVYLNAGTYGMMVEEYGLNASSNVAGLYVKNGDAYSIVPDGTAWADDTQYYSLHDKVIVGEKYYPISWYVENAGFEAITTAGRNIVDIADDMVDNIDGRQGIANQISDAYYQLTWEWKFEQGHDGEDTILGNLIAGKDNIVVLVNDTFCTLEIVDGQAVIDNTVYANLEVRFEIEVTVQQVD